MWSRMWWLSCDVSDANLTCPISCVPVRRAHCAHCEAVTTIPAYLNGADPDTAADESTSDWIGQSPSWIMLCLLCCYHAKACMSMLCCPCQSPQHIWTRRHHRLLFPVIILLASLDCCSVVWLASTSRPLSHWCSRQWWLSYLQHCSSSHTTRFSILTCWQVPTMCANNSLRFCVHARLEGGQSAARCSLRPQ